MDGANAANGGFSDSESIAEDSSTPNSNSQSSGNSIHQQLQNQLLGQGSSQNSGSNSSTGQTAPNAFPPSGDSSKSEGEHLKHAKKMLSPIGLIQSVLDQFGAEPSEAEKQRRQQAIQKDRARMEQERMALEQWRQQQTQARTIQRQKNAELQSAARDFANTSRHVGDGQDEETLYQKIIADGQKRMAAKQNASASMPQGQQKGPDAGGGKKSSTNMFDTMMGISKKKNKDPNPIDLPMGE